MSSQFLTFICIFSAILCQALNSFRTQNKIYPRLFLSNNELPFRTHHQSALYSSAVSNWVDPNSFADNIKKMFGFKSESSNFVLPTVSRPATKKYAKKRQIVLPDLSQKEFPPIPKINDKGCNYDLIVIGSGPGGEAAAVQASKLGAKVAVIEKRKTFGGPTGLTSKAIREAAKRLCNAIDQIGGDRRKQMKNLWKRTFPILKSEAEVYQAKETRDRLVANNIDLFIGDAEFVQYDDGSKYPQVRIRRATQNIEITGENAIIATGSRPNRPAVNKNGVALPFTKNKFIDATEMGNLLEIPKAVAVIGGGVIAVEYATVLAQLGVGVSLICRNEEFLSFLDKEVRHDLRKRMRQDHILFVTNTIKSITIDESNDDKMTDGAIDETESSTKIKGSMVNVYLNNDEQPLGPTMISKPKLDRVLRVDLVLYSGGRDANSEDLGLQALNISIGQYGRINVDQYFRTTSYQNIYAVGDVTGISGLASTAQYQARYVVESIFRNQAIKDDNRGDMDESDEDLDVDRDSFFSLGSNNEDAASKDGSKETSLFGSNVPTTLWTVPEIASVGLNIDQANKMYENKKDYKVIQGCGYFKDLARGRLSGDIQGYLKIITVATPDDLLGPNKKRSKPSRHKILGVQIIGEGANELIQFGSMLVNSGTTIEEISKTPFAAVTLCGLFQLACDDCIQKVKDYAKQ